MVLRKVDFNDLRKLGHYIDHVSGLEEGKTILGKCYYAGCSRADKHQCDSDLDSDIIRKFTGALIEVLVNYDKCYSKIEEDALDFEKTIRGPFRPMRFGSRPSLYELSFNLAENEGVFGVGRNLDLASTKLKKQLPQDNDQFVEQDIALILSRYLV